MVCYFFTESKQPLKKVYTGHNPLGPHLHLNNTSNLYGQGILWSYKLEINAACIDFPGKPCYLSEGMEQVQIFNEVTKLKNPTITEILVSDLSSKDFQNTIEISILKKILLLINKINIFFLM